MTVQMEKPRQQHQRVPLWRNVTFLKWAAQITFLVGVLLVFWILGREAATNLEDKGIDVSFDFLADPPGIALGEDEGVLVEVRLFRFADAKTQATIERRVRPHRDHDLGAPVQETQLLRRDPDHLVRATVQVE